MNDGDAEAFVPPGATILARADSNTGVVVPTLEGVRDAVAAAFAEDVMWLGAGIAAELATMQRSTDQSHAAESFKDWVGRTLRRVQGWNDPNSPEKDEPGFLDMMNDEQIKALVLLGDYAMYRSRQG